MSQAISSTRVTVGPQSFAAGSVLRLASGLAVLLLLAACAGTPSRPLPAPA